MSSTTNWTVNGWHRLIFPFSTFVYFLSCLKFQLFFSSVVDTRGAIC